MIRYCSRPWSSTSISTTIVSSKPRGYDGLRRPYGSHLDVACLDAMLPDLDGWEVLKYIGGMTDVRDVILTAHGAKSEGIKGVKGVNGVKPAAHGCVSKSVSAGTWG